MKRSRTLQSPEKEGKGPLGSREVSRISIERVQGILEQIVALPLYIKKSRTWLETLQSAEIESEVSWNKLLLKTLQSPEKEGKLSVV